MFRRAREDSSARRPWPRAAEPIVLFSHDPVIPGTGLTHGAKKNIVGQENATPLWGCGSRMSGDAPHGPAQVGSRGGQARSGYAQGRGPPGTGGSLAGRNISLISDLEALHIDAPSMTRARGRRQNDQEIFMGKRKKSHEELPKQHPVERRSRPAPLPGFLAGGELPACALGHATAEDSRLNPVLMPPAGA